MWGVQIEINLCPSVKNGCHYNNLHRTDNHTVNFVDTSCTDFYPAWMKNVETYGAEFHLQPPSKVWLSFHQFSEKSPFFNICGLLYTKVHYNQSTNMYSWAKFH